MGNIFSISLNLDSLMCGCWGCIDRHSKYLCQLQEDLDSLKSAFANLTEARDDVKGQVVMAEREQLQPLEQARGWLSRVQTLETHVNQLIGDSTEEFQRKCLGGYCPKHCRIQYKLGKRVSKLSKDVGQLIEEKPKELPKRIPPPGVTKRPCEATVGMDSILDQAWSCLHEDRVGILALYGLGGVGKTTLMTQINNAFTERPHHFDLVIWVTVSRNVDLERIQDDIWKKIGICDDIWKSKGRAEKAASIWNALSNNRFVLLLDDVWQRLNLVDVGVPLRNKINKTVLTTRSTEICGEMEADRKIKVECLTWSQSWDLFQIKVGEHTLKLHPDIPKLAEEVARECCGLPLVLTTMGRAMACKRTYQEWKYTVEMLKNSASNFPGMVDKVLNLLKYSYDSLPTEAARSCFLYCSLFPEDWEMPKKQLIALWICEGFLDAYDDTEAAINQGYNIIGTLIHACLLEVTDDEFNMKLHDVIRDMALWIACESGRARDQYLVKAGCGLTKTPEVGEWKEPKRISLMKNQIEQLIGSPRCPNLVTLFLDCNPLKVIADDFFQYMSNLRVLKLSDTAITELPKGISYLVSLQLLNLSFTKIKELPIELKNLDELKYLLLNRMPQFFSIPKQLVSSLRKLRKFLFSTSTIFDGAILKDDLLSDGHEALIKELESLKYLYDFCVPIKTAFALERLLGSEKLRSCIYSLLLQNLNTSSSLNIASLNNAKHLHSLCISDCVLLEDLEIEWAWEGKETIESNYLNPKVSFDSLEYVQITECRKLKDLTWLVFAPNLKALTVSKCDQMQEVVSTGHKCAAYVEDGESLSPFGKLRELVLVDLPLLKSIFWKALPFTCLISMRIYNCPLLKKLPLNTDSAKGHHISIYGNKEWWNELEWEDK